MIQVFENKEFGKVRTTEVNGQPYFVGKDVAEILGYTNPSKAIADHVDDEDKLNNETLSSLGQRGGWLINESGLYSLILISKLPKAKAFKRWVTSEVLPSRLSADMACTQWMRFWQIRILPSRHCRNSKPSVKSAGHWKERLRYSISRLPKCSPMSAITTLSCSARILCPLPPLPRIMAGRQNGSMPICMSRGFNSSRVASGFCISSMQSRGIPALRRTTMLVKTALSTPSPIRTGLRKADCSFTIF